MFEDDCSDCGVGYYSRAGDANCSLCQAGRYGTSEGMGQCDLCEAGKASETVGAT